MAGKTPPHRFLFAFRPFTVQPFGLQVRRLALPLWLLSGLSVTAVAQAEAVHTSPAERAQHAFAEQVRQAGAEQLVHKLQQRQWQLPAVIKAFSQRITELDEQYHAVIALAPDLADQVKILEFRFERGESLPLYGLPVLVKDNVAVMGMANTAGALVLKDNISDKDAPLIAKLKAKGAVILGKTNLSEWANFRSSYASSGWSTLGGQTGNAVDPSRNPCGSSSGSAVAVALDYAAIAIGSETDGSIVCPASANGVVGVKPSHGLVADGDVVPLAPSQDTLGFMAKQVSDVTWLMQRLAYVSATNTRVNPVSKWRVAALPDDGFSPAAKAAYQQLLTRLKSAGAQVTLLTVPDLSTMHVAEYEVLLYEFKHYLNAYLQRSDVVSHAKDLQGVIAFNNQHADSVLRYFGQDILEQAQAKGPLTETAYQQALHTSKQLAAQTLDGFYQQAVDVVIAPTNSPAWKTDLVNGDHYQGGSSALSAISGYPSVTIPYQQVDGLPLGLSLLGKQAGDAVVLQQAELLQRWLAVP